MTIAGVKKKPNVQFERLLASSGPAPSWLTRQGILIRQGRGMIYPGICIEGTILSPGMLAKLHTFEGKPLEVALTTAIAGRGGITHALRRL